MTQTEVGAAIGDDPEPSEALSALQKELRERENGRIHRLFYHAVTGIHQKIDNRIGQFQGELSTMRKEFNLIKWIIGTGLALISILITVFGLIIAV